MSFRAPGKSQVGSPGCCQRSSSTWSHTCPLRGGESRDHWTVFLLCLFTPQAVIHMLQGQKPHCTAADQIIHVPSNKTRTESEEQPLTRSCAGNPAAEAGSCDPAWCHPPPEAEGWRNHSNLDGNLKKKTNNSAGEIWQDIEVCTKHLSPLDPHLSAGFLFLLQKKTKC